MQPGRAFAYRWDWDEWPKILWSDLGQLLGAAPGRPRRAAVLERLGAGGRDKYIVLDSPEGGGIRMSRETETVAELVAAIEADSTFAAGKERCTQLALVHRTSGGAFDFAAAAGGSCAAFSPAALLAAAR